MRCWAVTAVCLLVSLPANAEDEPKKRPTPEYDGRPEESNTAEDVALAIPRVVLFPTWLVSEFIVRRPLEWFVTNAEKNQWPALLLEFFTFGEERKVGLFPTGLV